MNRPDYISPEDVLRWDEMINNDTMVPGTLKDQAMIREIMIAGFWLMEQLETLGCEEHLIVQLQYTLGAKSFGANCWVIAQELLTAYKANELDILVDEEEVSEAIENLIKEDVPRDPKIQN